jgi:hypothetical protein
MIDPDKVWDIDDIKMADCAAGRFFFEPNAMRFFRSRIGSTVYQGQGGIYFVTSEQFVGSQGASPRKYSVRQFIPSPVDIRTVSGFNNLSRAEAVRIAKQLAQGEPHKHIPHNSDVMQTVCETCGAEVDLR